MSVRYWQVAVNAPIRELLTYHSVDSEFKRGESVFVPLGKRKAHGVVFRECETTTITTKEILGKNPFRPILSEPFIAWYEWLAKYYLYYPGNVIESAFPPLDTRGKSQKEPIIKGQKASYHHQLSAEQNQIFHEISKSSQFDVHLLFGVTGSGKTEVYMELLQNCINANKQGLFLLPEISLTPQFIQRFTSRFGEEIAVIHSQLTERERTEEWWKILERKKKILLGARSALFCPIPDLGLIVLDEEHEPSFKQDEKLKYHARDSAIMLAKYHNIPIVLGSATPSLESWRNVTLNKYKIHRLDKRIKDQPLPKVTLIDLRKTSQEKSDLPFWLSKPLFEDIQKNLDDGLQTALFLNRRGMAQVVLCPDCGFSEECPNCDIGLTSHGKNHLVCHYCDFHKTLQVTCPSCKTGQLKEVGTGTELVEQEIKKLFPEAKVLRADRDEIQTREAMAEVIQMMESKSVDILVGTQMIAKGLDFPYLATVGVLVADIGLNLPDFRAGERCFQLLTQVSGRAGRHKLPNRDHGQVFIQTFQPENASIQFANHLNFEGFAQQELIDREALLYPPFGRMINFRFSGLDQNKVLACAKKIQKKSVAFISNLQLREKIEVLGPAPAPLLKIRNQYRYNLLFKSPDSQSLHRLCNHLLRDETLKVSGVRIIPDVDPLHLL